MHRARTFFYVCAGLVCLVVAYQVGASRAAAQAGATIEAAGFNTDVALEVAFCSNRVLYWSQSTNGTNWLIPARLGAGGQPVPGTSPIAACKYGYVLLANGDLYQDTGSWSYLGNLVGAPTPALRQSFGQLKAKYR